MNINSVEHCSGCLLCKELCPKKCITTKKDKLGHIHPVIDKELCVDCGICAKACPEMSPIELNAIKEVHAGWDNENCARTKSSSGGAATLIAQEFVKAAGIVYGCAFVQPFGFEHVRCTDLASLEALRGSKYVQSNTGNCWSLLRADLKEGKKVLFIGTPCQVAAARRAFKKAENLYTIDLICHGVPSVDTLRRSLPKDIAESEGISNITFRDSTAYQIKVLDKDGSIIHTRPLYKDWYLKGFFTALYNRDSCYNCKYANIDRVGDITLGDFWGVDEKAVSTDTGKGVSAIIVNSANGSWLLSLIKSKASLTERDVAEVREGNKPLNHPSKKSFRYNIYKVLNKVTGFNTAVKLSLPEIALKSFIFRRK